MQNGANAAVLIDEAETEVVQMVRFNEPNSAPSDFTPFLNHPVLIDHQTVTSTFAYARATKDLVAFYKTNAPATMSNKLANMFYFRSKIRIKVVVQGMSFAAGMFVISFTPRVNPIMITSGGTSVPTGGNFTNCRIVPHIVVDPSKTATYELDLPVVAPNGYYSFSPTYSNGSYAMEYFPLVPLFSGTATAASMNICVYMSFPDPQFQGLTTLLSNPLKEEKTGTASSFLKTSSTFLGALAPFGGEFAPAMTAFSGATGAVGMFLERLGYSRPTNISPNQVSLVKQASNWTQSSGEYGGYLLGATSDQSLGIAPEYVCGSPNDMLVAEIAKIPGLIKYGTAISTAATEGTLLDSRPVTPTDRYNLENPPLYGVAIASDYWCGDITYRFEFLASVFHRATVVIAFDPGSPGSAPTLPVALTTLKNVTVNISGNTTVDVTLPFKQPMPVLPTKGTVGPMTTNGTWYMFMLNPVTSNGGGGIYYNVYSFSENIALLGTDQVTIATRVYNYETYSSPVRESFGPPTNLTDLEKRIFGERMVSVKQFAAKMGTYRSGATAGTVTADPMTVAGIPNFALAANENATGRTMTLLGWMSQAFLGYRGGLNYSYSGRESPLTPSVKILSYYNPLSTVSDGAPYKTNLAGTVMSVTNYAYTEVNPNLVPRLDITVPMTIPLDFVPRGDFSNFTSGVYFSELFPGAGATVVPTYDILQGAGDDFTLAWFLGFPATTT